MRPPRLAPARSRRPPPSAGSAAACSWPAWSSSPSATTSRPRRPQSPPRRPPRGRSRPTPAATRSSPCTTGSRRPWSTSTASGPSSPADADPFRRVRHPDAARQRHGHRHRHRPPRLHPHQPPRRRGRQQPPRPPARRHRPHRPRHRPATRRPTWPSSRSTRPGRCRSCRSARRRDLMVGETVIAIGNAYGYEHTVTDGRVSLQGPRRDAQQGHVLQGPDPDRAPRSTPATAAARC